MDINEAVAQFQANPRVAETGMFLIHLGLVRQTNLAGQKVEGLTVDVDEDRVEPIRQWALARPGVVDVFVRFNRGYLRVGQPIMLAAVAGRTRDEVFPVLKELIDRLKTEVTHKTEETA